MPRARPKIAWLCCLATSCIAPLFAANEMSATGSQNTVAQRMWVIDSAQRCGGRYIEPARDAGADEALLAGGDAIAYASVIDYENDGRSALRGGIQVAFGARRLVAETAVLEGAHVELDGRTRLDEPGIYIDGGRAVADLDDERVSIEQASFLLLPSEFHGRAERIEVAGEALRLERSAFTACAPGKRGWRVVAKEIDYAEDEVFARAKQARVEFFGVPLIYLPRLRFPVSSDRASGFLFPSAEQSSDDGTDIGIPYYMNIAPNMDATIAPRWIAKRGPGVEAEWRYLSAQSRWNVNGAFLHRDERYNGFVDRLDFTDSAPFESADRWLGRISQRGRWRHFRSRIDFAAASDNDYFLDLGSGLGIISQHALERRGELAYERGGLEATIWAQRFQRLETQADPYRREPEFRLNYSRVLAPFTLDWRSSVAWFDSALANVATGRRTHLQPRIKLEVDRPGAWFASDATVYRTAYDLDAIGRHVDDLRTLFAFSAGSGLRFEKRSRGGLTHTLEPALRYRYVSHEDQDELPQFDTGSYRTSFDALMRERRYLGLDRIADRNDVVASVQSRWLDPLNPGRTGLVRAAWVEALQTPRVRVYEDDLLFDRLLVVGAEWQDSMGRLQLRQRVDGVWNAAERVWDEVAASSRVTLGNGLIFNAGVKRRPRDDVRQTDVGLAWQLDDRFELVGRWNFDWRTDRTLESLAGLSYADCCFAVSLLWFKHAEARRNVRPLVVRAREGLMLQFEFRGLGGVGTRLRSRIARAIRGYDDARDAWGGEIFDEE